MRSVVAANAAIGTVASRTSRLSACHTAAKPERLGPPHEAHRLPDRVGVLQVERHRHPGEHVVALTAATTAAAPPPRPGPGSARRRPGCTRPPSTTTSPSTTTRSARTPGVKARYQGSARSARPGHLVAEHLGHEVGAGLQPRPRRLGRGGHVVGPLGHVGEGELVEHRGADAVAAEHDPVADAAHRAGRA